MPTTPSVLEAVTIYREGAICARRARVDRPGTVVRLGGLPLAMVATSLRAEVRAGGVSVQDVRSQLDVHLADELDVPQEQRALEAAEDALNRLELRQTRLETELGELSALRPSFLEPRRGDPPRPASVPSMVALAEFADAELASRLERRRALMVELEAARHELRLRRARLAEASTARRSERARLERVAVITLSAAASGPVELGLEYQVPGVRWVPTYQLRLDRALSHGGLQLRASVAQNTGEDWRAVQLALSTASLTRRTEVPVLKALKIGRRQETPPRSGWREPPAGLDSLFEAYDDAAATRPQTPRKPTAAPPPPPPSSAAVRAEAGSLGGARSDRALGPPPTISASMRTSAPGRVRAAAPATSMTREKKFADEPREAEAEETNALLDEAPMGLPPDDDGGVAPALEGTPAHRSGLDAGLRDYDRLAMPPPEAPGRGRLQPLGAWDGLLTGQVTVEVSVVMALVAVAQEAAATVSGLTLPAGTKAVAPVQAFDYRYDCVSPVDVASTGRWVTIPVASCAVTLTPQYVVVPAVEPAVYRTLQLGNDSALALLPGPVDVMAGDEFLLTSTLPAVPPGAQALHRLGLGVEEAIKVARRTTYKEMPGGFLGGSTVLAHEVEVEIANRLGSPVPIEVRERLPCLDPGAEKEARVEEGAASPPWEVVEEPLDGDQVVRGARRWRLTVAPGEVLTARASYTIRIPSDAMLVGGNRRA